MSDNNNQFAIIAGSGFASFGDQSSSQQIETEFGWPSSPLRELNYGERTVLLLARHGDKLAIPPHEINYRANLMALNELHVDSIIALNTVGTVESAHQPGQLAVPDQLIDYTYGRDHSIYNADSATLDHIDFTEPFDAGLRSTLLQAAADVEAECHDGGVYAVTQGPRLETAAEVNRLERDGARYVGMTAMPEAALARELGIAYACLSLIVNYAAGRGELAIHEDIEASTANARAQAMQVLRRFFQTCG
jgi:5'-methylthioinosine phosphorylase